MKNLVLIVVLVILSVSCSTSTKITGSWKNAKEIPKDYKNIFIAVMTGNNTAKSTLENEMETALNAFGIATDKSMEEFPPGFLRDSLSKAEMIQKMRAKGSQAVLTVSLLKKETTSRFEEGSYMPMERFGYYRNFSGYYNYRYPYVYNPGYYVRDEIYYLETNLYDMNTELLIWSAQSETYSYDGLRKFAKDFAEQVVEKMKVEGVLKNAGDKNELAKIQDK